jgi:hypothetical protein
MRSILTYEKHFDRCDLSKTQRVQGNKAYSTIALAKSAMECIPLHSWEMDFLFNITRP